FRSLRLCPGHTAGLMVVSCETERGPVVLASDAAHLYANIMRGIPFPIFIDEPAYGRAQQRVLDLAGGSLDHVIPGHDPLVLACFPSENDRSEEHTSELQSRENLVCRLLLEKKNT